MNTLIKNETIDDLKLSFSKMREEKKLRHRDAALAMGLTEGEAIALFVGEHVTRLENQAVEIFKEIPSLGKVLAITRNQDAVHEKLGEYKQISFSESMGIALGVIDLRIFKDFIMASVFAVEEPTPRGLMKSLQFFDQYGYAIHKIFLKEESDHLAYQLLIEKWAMREQTPGLAVAPLPLSVPELDDSALDIEGMRLAWENLQDTHDFFGMMKKYQMSRTQILRLTDPKFAYQISPNSVRTMLEKAAKTELPIMVFVGNPGMIQIHTGKIHTVKVIDNWLNILDDEFNLHLKEDAIHQVWVVKKPTADGIVTSLELFDKDGHNIAMFFGERKPGVPELTAWRDLVNTFEALPQ